MSYKVRYESREGMSGPLRRNTREERTQFRIDIRITNLHDSKMK